MDIHFKEEVGKPVSVPYSWEYYLNILSLMFCVVSSQMKKKNKKDFYAKYLYAAKECFFNNNVKCSTLMCIHS